MRYRTVVERVGEKVGPVDWRYDFASHFTGYCCDEHRRAELCRASVIRLRALVDGLGAGEQWEASVLGSDCYHRVLDVGMWDGSPHWRPTPSVLIASPVSGFAPEWHPFSFVTNVRRSK